MTQGCESWTLDATSEKRIATFEMKCNRKVLRIPYTAHRTNDSVNEDIARRGENYETLLSMIKRRKLKWFGHVSRYQEELGLAQSIMHGRLTGVRGRGRPRINWILNVTDWMKVSIDGVKKYTVKRSVQRDIVNLQKVHLGLLG